MILQLRIKKVYFDQIANGTKSIEYRADSNYYRKRFSEPGKFKKVILQYQQAPRIRADIIKIERIKNPFKKLKLWFLSTEKVFAIHLKNVELYKV